MRLINLFINNLWKAYSWATYKELLKPFDDEIHLKRIWKSVFGSQAMLDLNTPRTFNEKLQWLKLHDRNPLYNTLVDKYRVKPWVAERIGSEYVTETYACWERAEDIDISGLPERFVLKTNHDCGGVAVCSDRRKFDLGAARKKLAKHLRTNYYWGGREWPYKDVKPLVFAEEYLDPGESGDLVDYKFLCFSGEARCLFTCSSRAKGDLRVDFFDRGWNHLPFTRHYPNADVVPKRPDSYEEMLTAAERLSSDIPFVRVDFYESGGRPYFGEMTFYPGSGFEEFEPKEWDERLGSWIDLSGAYGDGGRMDG